LWNWMGWVQRQQGAGQWQSLASEAVGQQTKVADAHEASGQHVKEKAYPSGKTTLPFTNC
jgi:hypothetical protein